MIRPFKHRSSPDSNDNNFPSRACTPTDTNRRKQGVSVCMVLAYKFLNFYPDCLSSRHNVNFEVTSIMIMRQCSHTYTCRPQFLRRPFEKGAHLSLFPYARGPSNKFVRVIVPPLCATVLALCPDLIRQTECVQQHLAGMLTHDSTPCLSGSIGKSFLNFTFFSIVTILSYFRELIRKFMSSAKSD